MVKATRGFAPGNSMDRSSQPQCSVKSTQLDGCGDPSARSCSAQQSVRLTVTFALTSEAFRVAAPIDRARHAIIGLSTHASFGGRDRCDRLSLALDWLWIALWGRRFPCHHWRSSDMPAIEFPVIPARIKGMSSQLVENSTPQRVCLQNSRPHCYSESMGQPLIRLYQAVFPVWLCTGCVFGPSQERVDCLQSCARQKDSCILQASNAMAIQQCDSRGAWCSEQCPQ